MYVVDLNSDLGESFGAYKMGRDEQIIPLISSANVACGFHAGDPSIMEKTVELCAQHGVAVGAHPGFPDLVGFGRRNMNVSVRDVKNMVIYQVGALAAFCKAKGVKLQHVKPHGALYNMAAKDEALAEAVCQGILAVDDSLILMGLAGSRMLEQAAALGLSCASEVFADRAYEDDGSLVARTKPGAMITDEELAVDRVIGMIKNHNVTSVNGKQLQICPDSVCVHGDSDHALLFVNKIRAALTANGIEIISLNGVI